MGIITLERFSRGLEHSSYHIHYLQYNAHSMTYCLALPFSGLQSCELYLLKKEKHALYLTKLYSVINLKLLAFPFIKLILLGTQTGSSLT